MKKIVFSILLVLAAFIILQKGNHFFNDTSIADNTEKKFQNANIENPQKNTWHNDEDNDYIDEKTLPNLDNITAEAGRRLEEYKPAMEISHRFLNAVEDALSLLEENKDDCHFVSLQWEDHINAIFSQFEIELDLFDQNLEKLPIEKQLDLQAAIQNDVLAQQSMLTEKIFPILERCVNVKD
ncbi:MAG: hypothetical protein AAGB12_14560 [Pseudomonadota bacterium]